MGCQCAKSPDTTNMHLESNSPPPKIDISESKINDTVNQSKIEHSKADGLENSKITKKKKKKKLNDENFAVVFVNELNKIRANPSEFYNAIMDSIVNIKEDKGKIFYETEGKKISLIKGRSAFEEAANKLLETRPCEPLELREDLLLPLEEDPKLWTDNKIISEILAVKKKQNGEKYPDCSFQLDIEVVDPKTCLLLQIVDDNKFQGKRRENLLNPLNKFIGVSSKMIKKKFCVYFLLAKSQ